MFSRAYTAAFGIFVGLTTSSCLLAQPKPGSDVLTLIDGEKLIGQLVSANGSKVVFNSNLAGAVTVEWSKIQELHSENKFAAIPKALTLAPGSDGTSVTQGTLAMTNQTLNLSAAPPAQAQTLPVQDVSRVLPELAFEKDLHHQGFFEGWKGSATLGISIAESTQDSKTVNTAFDLERSDPSANWLETRNRTTLDFNGLYGIVSQAGSPNIKISIYHADALRDFYFKPRVFAFLGATWDHNYSQGLNLSQAYGGGLGVVLFKGEHSELDARAGLGYTDLQFDPSSLNRQLIGSRLSENFSHTFAHGIMLNEQAGFRPSWNYTRAYFGGFLVGLTVPVYHRFGVTLTSYDSFLNIPPPGLNKNSFQLTIGATYSFQ
jgi:hypothetical protein